MRAKAITGVAAGLFLQKGANDCALNVPGITQCTANDCAKQKAAPGIRAQKPRRMTRQTAPQFMTLAQARRRKNVREEIQRTSDRGSAVTHFCVHDSIRGSEPDERERTGRGNCRKRSKAVHQDEYGARRTVFCAVV